MTNAWWDLTQLVCFPVTFVHMGCIVLAFCVLSDLAHQSWFTDLLAAILLAAMLEDEVLLNPAQEFALSTWLPSLLPSLSVHPYLLALWSFLRWWLELLCSVPCHMHSISRAPQGIGNEMEQREQARQIARLPGHPLDSEGDMTDSEDFSSFSPRARSLSPSSPQPARQVITQATWQMMKPIQMTTGVSQFVPAPTSHLASDLLRLVRFLVWVQISLEAAPWWQLHLFHQTKGFLPAWVYSFCFTLLARIGQKICRLLA
jgi:hypothetical protein